MYTFHAWWSQNVVVSRRTRRWAKLALLSWQQDFPVSYSRQKFLADLSQSPDYHNEVLFRGTALDDAPEAHGPYATRRITPDRFVALQPSQYRMRVRQVLYRPEFYPPDPLASDYVEDAFLEGWPDDVRFFELCLAHDFTRFGQPGFQVDFPCAEKLMEFTEFVVVMEQVRRVALLVFALD